MEHACRHSHLPFDFLQALQAQGAGAVAVIVVNNEVGGMLVEMGGDGGDVQPAIPAVSVSADAGAALRC